MPKPFLVFEDIQSQPQFELFRVASVRWTATSYAWLGPLFWCTLGLVVALVDHGTPQLTHSLLAGLRNGFLLYGVNIVHSLGHVIAGWLVGAPMDSVLLTATRDVTIYRHSGSTVPSGRRLGRACGGPACNLLLGSIVLALGDAQWLRLFGYFSIAVGAWTLTPIPTLDGAVIWLVLWNAIRRDAV